MTDLGWHQLDLQTGAAAPDRNPGFMGHDPPACLLLPDDTRACFLRCDDGDYMLESVRSSSTPTLWWACRGLCTAYGNDCT